MNASELRNKSVADLKEQLLGLRQEQFNLRMAAAAGQPAMPWIAFCTSVAVKFVPRTMGALSAPLDLVLFIIVGGSLMERFGVMGGAVK